MKKLVMLIGSLLMMQGGANAMENTKKAIFAGGCFWCMQAEFEGTEGVTAVVAGYTGGHTKDPTYEQVSTGTTGHAESIEVTYDPAKLPYEKLLNIYWSNVDPTDAGGQLHDRGTQYRTAIFYSNDEERKLAEASKEKIKAKLKKEIYTEIVPASTFYPAETYHQDYYKKNPVHFKMYEQGSGREEHLKEVWKDAKPE
jgi:methionine-S-sulfoxide reductase